MSNNGIWTWLASLGPWAWTRGAMWVLASMSLLNGLLSQSVYKEHSDSMYSTLGGIALSIILIATQSRWWRKENDHDGS